MTLENNMRRLIFVLALGLAAALNAQGGLAADGARPLLSPSELASVMADQKPLILDIRSNKAYRSGHIRGAVHGPYRLFRGPRANPGRLRSDAEWTAAFRALGLRKDRPIVIVHRGASASDFGAAARVYWTLKSTGFRSLSILNGGIAAWREADLPLSLDPVAPQPSAVTATLENTWLATAADVAAIIDGRADATLLDARPGGFWSGDQKHAAAARAGTLPQAGYFTHSNWFFGGAAIVDAAAARDLAEENGYAEAGPIVSFCNTGHWAATNWFALSELAGLPNVRLYPESMVGWTHLATNPVVKGGS